jgi:hypothetical protein
MVRRLLPLFAGFVLLAATAARADAAVVIRAAFPAPTSAFLQDPTDEWVRIRNTASAKRWIGGWTLRNHAGLKYTFPGRYLCGGCSVQVNTGRGTNSLANVYWGRTTPVWNNNSDQATLRTKAGVFADRCGWGTYAGEAPPRPGSTVAC